MQGVCVDLAIGDQIEIKYRAWSSDGCGDALVERWIHAWVIDCEPGTWPLVQLADGQITEVRPYMSWRMVSNAKLATSHRLPA